MSELPVTPERAERVRQALSQRLGSVVAVMEAVRRRHNASALIRSCEAFGIHEVHLISHGFKASIGASRAAERWVQTRVFPTTAESISTLRGRGFRVYVADLDARAFTPETVPVDAPLALLFGSEVRGVSDEARGLADGAVMIPMRGLTESLNVSVSGALMLRTVSDRRRALVGADLGDDERERFYDAWLSAETVSRRGLRARTE